MSLRRRVRRAVRRATRSVERAVRRAGREIERGWRPITDPIGDVVDSLGSIPVIGEALGATGLVETQAMKQAKKAEDMEKAQEAMLAKQARDQELEEQWAREQAQSSSQIEGTQREVKAPKSVDETDFRTILTDNGDEEEDILKRLIRKR